MYMELLAPAGSPEALDAAAGEGADAVYLGLKNFNARMRTANFAYSQFEAALRAMRRMKKKVYVTVNTVFEQREADRMYQLLKYLSSVAPDALIVQDFGVLMMVISEFPQLKIHSSTQMNIASAKGANVLSKNGVSRVVLSRELSLEELRLIRSDTNMELEVFTHGALCVSASGLCLFSSYLGGKSANRGMCTQACRRLYHVIGEGGAESKEGYYFSPADLQLLEHLPELAAAGINAVKIEGRMKSADYVGTVVSAYRLVLDAIAENGDVNGDDEKIRLSIAKGREILRNDFARAKTTFHFCNTGSIDWLNPDQDGGTGINLGLIQATKTEAGERRCLVSARVAIAVGDTIRLHRSNDSMRVSHKVQYAEPSREGTVGGYWLSIPGGFGKGDSVYLIRNKVMSKRYRHIIGGEKSGRQPGHEQAPNPPEIKRIASKRKNGADIFPEGLYVSVSNVNDMYIVQSSRPAKLMLKLTIKNAKQILQGESPLPFKPAETIMVLEPFFPEGNRVSLMQYPHEADRQQAPDNLSGMVRDLIDMGYRYYVINNLGHLSLFYAARKVSPSGVHLIAGPWLYMFNAWALSYIASLGVDGFVSPLENNRQNLERTVSTGNHQFLRSMVFVPVFAWPPLFRIRSDLGSLYNFKAFSGNLEETFSLVCDPEGSLVIPEKPFSITDKIPFLKEAGFRRFIIDLCGTPLKKKDYKDLMQAVRNGTPLPRISRFNWKNGFFSGE